MTILRTTAVRYVTPWIYVTSDVSDVMTSAVEWTVIWTIRLEWNVDLTSRYYGGSNLWTVLIERIEISLLNSAEIVRSVNKNWTVFWDLHR
jgi:hypothetical protein